MVTPRFNMETLPRYQVSPMGESVTATVSAKGGDAFSTGHASTAAYLFLVLDASHPMGNFGRHRLDGVTRVKLGRGERGVVRNGSTLQLALPDRRASSQHAELTLEADGWWIEDLRSKNGTVVGGAPVSRRKLFDGALIEIGHTFLRFRAELAGASEAPLDLIPSSWSPPSPGLETLLPGLEGSFSELARMATTQTPMMVLGETGTGKDVTAHAYHVLMGRPGPFIPVNCGALPPSLIESALFGHRRGSFSGATNDQLGLVRAAEGGTLFLDEIGDLHLESQAALLRVIQAGEVTPIGSIHPVRVDIRIVAATHRDVRQMVRLGTFRADLFARLSGHVLSLPPLRERIEDLGILVGAALRQHAPARAASLELDRDAARVLLRRKYPLNTRELMNALSRAITLSNGDVIGPKHLETEVLGSAPEAPAQEEVVVGGGTLPGARSPAVRSATRLARRAQLELLLTEHQGNVTDVAVALGKTRAMIYKWLKQEGIDPDLFRR